MQRELALLQQLALQRAPRPIALTRQSGRQALVLEDAGLTPLSARLETSTVSIDQFFAIAVATCDALEEAHSRGVVIGAVNPQSILLDDRTDDLQIFDFSLAQNMPVDVAAMAASVLVPGVVQYVAPEQTGRISRLVDHRADLYSLGATLYHHWSDDRHSTAMIRWSWCTRTLHAPRERLARWRRPFPSCSRRSS